MPADLTIFAAKYLVFIEALLAAVILVAILYPRRRIEWVRWAVAVAIMLVLAYIFAKIGASIYNDPRPFVSDHIHPLISHAPDNGFPSDHGLLAAALVAGVAFVRRLPALIVAVLAVLVDWGRVGSGLHHVVDVIGSTLFVALAAAIALLVAPIIVRAIAPHLPEWARSTSAAVPDNG